EKQSQIEFVEWRAACISHAYRCRGGWEEPRRISKNSSMALKERRQMRRLIFTALASVLCILLGSATRAQRLDGTLRVTVMDKSQASIEGAKVTAENEDT